MYYKQQTVSGGSGDPGTNAQRHVRQELNQHTGLKPKMKKVEAIVQAIHLNPNIAMITHVQVTLLVLYFTKHIQVILNLVNATSIIT